MMYTRRLILICSLALILCSGCTNQNAARVGTQIGKVLGKPLGLVATTVDQAFRTTGEIVGENLRQQREVRGRQQLTEQPITIAEAPEQSDSGQSAETNNPLYSQQIELLSHQDTENREDFWK